jgi:hypothetical protein
MDPPVQLPAVTLPDDVDTIPVQGQGDDRSEARRSGSPQETDQKPVTAGEEH